MLTLSGFLMYINVQEMCQDSVFVRVKGIEICRVLHFVDDTVEFRNDSCLLFSKESFVLKSIMTTDACTHPVWCQMERNTPCHLEEVFNAGRWPSLKQHWHVVWELKK